MCSNCGVCFTVRATFESHQCKSKASTLGTGQNPMEIMSDLHYNNDEFAGEMNNTPQENRRTMFECKTCKKYFFSMDIFSKHSCAKAEEQTASTSSSTNVGTEGMFWTRPATLLLIDSYKERMDLMNTGRLRKKAAWMQISKILEGKGYSITGSQCEGRWKTLLRGLKSVHDHNQKSGNNPKQHPYESELAFMSEKPNVSQSYVVSSESVPLKADTAVEHMHTASFIENDSDSDSAKSENVAVTPKSSKTENEPKPKRKRPNEVVEVLKSFIETQQKRHSDECERREQMHREKMEIFGGFLELLKNAANNADKK